MANFPPQVFIVGSQKCGTTSLARLLEQNPSVCLSDPKEPHFYSVNYDKGADWYRSRFEDLGKVLVDASTTYTMCPLDEVSLNLKTGRIRQVGVPERIFKDRPDARIIYIVRDPVGRLYSNYWHNIKYGYEKQDLETAVLRDPQYIHQGQYFAQMEKYLEYFPLQNILIIKFEDFVRDQQSFLNICEEFIGVQKTVIEKAKTENKSQQYSRVGQFLINSRFLRNIEKIFPARAKQKLKSFLTREIPPLEEDLAVKLRSYFRSDLRQLKAVFGISYPE